MRTIFNAWRQPKPPEDICELVEQARQEMVTAEYYYNSVSDEDLIDHAVYLLQAAEKKYTYLLKKARIDERLNSSLS